jgi:hypothetical protein
MLCCLCGEPCCWFPSGCLCCACICICRCSIMNCCCKVGRFACCTWCWCWCWCIGLGWPGSMPMDEPPATLWEEQGAQSSGDVCAIARACMHACNRWGPSGRHSPPELCCAAVVGQLPSLPIRQAILRRYMAGKLNARSCTRSAPSPPSRLLTMLSGAARRFRPAAAGAFLCQDACGRDPTGERPCQHDPRSLCHVLKTSCLSAFPLATVLVLLLGARFGRQKGRRSGSFGLVRPSFYSCSLLASPLIAMGLSDTRGGRG